MSCYQRRDCQQNVTAAGERLPSFQIRAQFDVFMQHKECTQQVCTTQECKSTSAVPDKSGLLWYVKHATIKYDLLLWCAETDSLWIQSWKLNRRVHMCGFIYQSRLRPQASEQEVSSILPSAQRKSLLLHSDSASSQFSACEDTPTLLVVLQEQRQTEAEDDEGETAHTWGKPDQDQTVRIKIVTIIMMKY